MIDATRHPKDIVERGIFLSKMVTVQVLLDEEMARELKLHNREPVAGKGGTNRKPSKVREEIYYQAMIRDEWALSPEPIVLEEPNDKGETDLTDGQQRLNAFLRVCAERPGFTIPVTVTYNAPSSSRMVINTGKAKTPADFLRMNGEKYALVLSQAVKLLYVFNEVPFTTVGQWRSVKMTATLQSEYLQKHLGLRGGVDRVKANKSPALPYVAATLYYLISQEHDVFKANQFLEALEKGIVDGITPEDARWRVREFLAAKSKETGFTWDGIMQLALLIQAFNDWVLGYEGSFRPAASLKMLNNAPRFPRLVQRRQLEGLDGDEKPLVGN